jgi:hypothetical protein
MIMLTQKTTAGNARKLQQLQRVIDNLLSQILEKGFFGTGTIELDIQDGTIQNIRVRVERVER